MNKKIVRGIALNLTILQLLSQQTVLFRKSNNNDTYKPISKIVSLTDLIIPRAEADELVLVDSENSIYQRIDDETGERKPISIFDDDNIRNHQYGANQKDFHDNFKELIKDPVIWDEMQKYFPVDSFESQNEAMYFYQKYFDIICECGCGYAAAANYVFRLFEGHEEEFYKTFGYPMYRLSYNNIDFNYETFMLKFFNFLVIDKLKQNKLIIKTMNKDLCHFRLQEYLNNDENKLGKPSRSWTEEEWNTWRNNYHIREQKIEELENKWKKAKNEYYNFGISLDKNFGYLYQYLRKHKISINISLVGNTKKLAIDDIIASDDFNLFQVDEYGNIAYNYDIDLHYVYITEVDGNNIMVSSWGNKYMFDKSKTSEISRINIKKK